MSGGRPGPSRPPGGGEEMKIRVVTWNMGCGSKASQYRKSHGEAWDYLLRELRPDVALIQEALVAKIEEARHGHSVIICDLDPGVTAGTAVLVRKLDVNVAPSVAVSPHTYTATTEIKTSAGPLTVVSVHVYPGKEQYTDLKRLVDLLGSAFMGQGVLVGGDFNAARRFDEVYGGKKYQTFFAAMKTAGLHDVHWGIHGHEVQSFWGHQATEAYQDDHFFIAKAWSTCIRSCNIIDNEIVRRVSDHGPVVLELDISAA